MKEESTRDPWVEKKITEEVFAVREESTCWVEKKIGYDTLVWICEECEFTTQFECDGPEENNYNFCPKCGRKITEYVKYVDPVDEEENQ